MRDDARENGTRSDAQAEEIDLDEGGLPSVPLDRRSVLGGLATIAASGSAVGGASAEEDDSKAAGGSDAWEPAEVPFGMQTPWYDQVSPADAHAEYPRPQLVRRQWRPLNGVWEFEAASPEDSPPFDRQLDEHILVPFPPESALSGIRRHEPRMWYRTTFSVPEEWLVPTAHPGEGIERNPHSQRLELHFERVDWKATVFVNGEEVASHTGGYDSFSVDVTEYLTAEGEQELVVGVYDPTESGTQPVGKQEVQEDRDIFFTPSSGIWDTVWLEPVPEPHIEEIDLSPNLDEERLELVVDAPEGETVRATAYDDDDAVNSVTGPTNERLDLPIPGPNRWSPDDPFLYGLRVELQRSRGNGGGRRDDEESEEDRASDRDHFRRVDSIGSYFGMRSIGKRSIRGVVRPTLNGEFVLHNGIYDQGYWPDGLYTPPTDEARRFDLQLAKRLGYNAYRKHLKIPSKRWYYWADRLGLLVWQDVPNQPLGQPVENEDAQEQFRDELRDMVTQNDNHPSLAVWIPVNEGWGHGKTNYDRIRSTTRFVRDLDDERLIDSLSGIDTMFVDGEVEGDVIDFHNYGQLTPLPEPTETQMSVVGESSSGWVPIEGHQWDDGDPSGGTPADLVDNLLTRAGNLQDYVAEDGLSGAINLQTTDTEFHYQGVVTYDRKVFKPELASDDAVERIRAANEAAIEASRAIEQGPYLTVDAPLSHSLGDGTFEVAATFTNPEHEAEGSFDVHDVALDLTGLPTGLASEATSPISYDVVPEGSSETANWAVGATEGGDPDPGVYQFGVEATFDDGDGTASVSESTAIELEPAGPVEVGFWPFDEGSGDTATDAVGDNEGTLVGDPVWVAGQVDSALSFDGSDDYVDTNANVLDTTRDYSVAAWVRLADASGFQTAVSQVMGDGTAFFLQYLGIEDAFSFSFFGGRAFGGPAVEAGRWYHVAGVHDTYEERAKLYVDGERVASIDRAPTASDGSLLVGRATVGGNAVDFWNGTIDQVHAYQSSLDDEEVASLFESER